MQNFIPIFLVVQFIMHTEVYCHLTFYTKNILLYVVIVCSLYRISLYNARNRIIIRAFFFVSCPNKISVNMVDMLHYHTVNKLDRLSL